MDHPFIGVPSDGSDYRGIPTQTCPCGGNQFYITAWFSEDTYEVAGYLTDAMCSTCGALVTACTEIDHPEYQN